MHRLASRLARAASACVAAALVPAAVAFSDSKPAPATRTFAPTKAQLASHFDHTLLKPEATPSDVEKLCREAHEHGFACVCVNPCNVAHARATLANLDSKAGVCAVVGFPLGANTTETKVFEARQAIRDGANEIDMVINIGWLKARRLEAVATDIAEVVRECRTRGVVCKVIIETCLLTHEEKLLATWLAISAGADFVKTSTGFSTGGATIEDVEELAQMAHAGGAKFKASGGVKDGLTALAMIAAGADRIGASKSVQLCEEAVRIVEQGESALFKSSSTKQKSDGY